MKSVGVENKETEAPKFLEEGDVIELKPGHTVYAAIAQRYVFDNTPESNELFEADVTIGENKKGLDTSYLAGKYVVTKTAFEGGGKAMWNDEYPDGHHVYCRRMLEEGKLGEEVTFYQSGAFTAMITDIKPVGKVEFRHIPLPKK